MNFRSSIIYVLVLLSFNATGQLLRNGFEVNTGWPQHLGEWSNVVGLINPTSGESDLASPDYFHVSGSEEADCPETAYATLNPHTGDAMIGVHVADKSIHSLREYLTFQFAQDLEVGKSYHFKFHWSNGKVTPVSPAGLSIMNLGVYFSDTIPSQIGSASINIEPQFKFDEWLYSETWCEANISFVATNNARFVTIGMFGMDDTKSLLNSIVSGAEVAYFYFDDFQLWEVNEHHLIRVPWIDAGMPKPTTIELEGKEIVYVPNSFTPNGDGTNDYFLKLGQEVLGWNVEIFNRWGQLVFHSNQATQGWDGSNIAQELEEDVYYWKLRYANLNGEIKNVSGNVFLIR
jgi:gliding motility-associated-like protein